MPGLIQMTGSTRIYGALAGSRISCFLSTGTGSVLEVNQTIRRTYIPSENVEGLCSTNGSLQVAAGTYVVNLAAYGPPGADLDDTTFDVHFIAGGTLAAADIGAASDAPEKVEPTP